ncbi:MAG: phosphoribosylformylglycinamidine synthase subunit PurQ [Euryarchaeota archaeon]|nr:phosphoribosylformylglycinamidine synthase subunit PurQ [Euryarchaeota archaeon]
MRPRDVRVCVLRIEGTNCEQEAYQAFADLGAQPEIVHLKQLTGAAPERMRRNLEDYHALMFPGGFSAGDYVRAGAVLAARVKSALSKNLVPFIESGKPVLGVCNGFQALVELGMLPGFGGPMAAAPEAALGTNDSGRFECRPTFLKNENKGKCAFTATIPHGGVIMCPSAHAEGKFILPIEQERELLKRLEDSDQIVFRYVNPEGKRAGHPWNPNGSLDDIAGICSAQGNVMGMMPHPERVFTRYTHPDWTRNFVGPRGDGMAIFESILEYVAHRF